MKTTRGSPAARYSTAFAREKLGSTGLGRGIAIPHGRIKDLQQASGAFFRLAHPCPFDLARDGEPVSLLFVLLVPEQATEQHLQILSELAERFSERLAAMRCAPPTAPKRCCAFSPKRRTGSMPAAEAGTIGQSR